MKLSEKLLTNYRCGKMTVVQDNNNKLYCIFSTPDSDGGLRESDWDITIEGCMQSVGNYHGNTKRNIDEQNWSIIKTIDFASLGEGYRKGERVRILPNAKEECEKGAMWDDDMAQMIKDGCGFIAEKNGGDWGVWNKDRSGWFYFPCTCLEPYFEDKETIKIGNRTYDKGEVEKALSGIKSLN